MNSSGAQTLGTFTRFSLSELLQKKAKQVIILYVLLGTTVHVFVVFAWKTTGVPGGNSPVQYGDRMTLYILV